MRNIKITKQFRKDVAQLSKSGRYNMKKLKVLMDKIIEDENLPPQYNDHALHGKWQGCRDCHIQGDWVLIYEILKLDNGNELLIFNRTGTHAELFG